MLMRLNKAETAVHGCHSSSNMAVRMRKAMAILRIRSVTQETILDLLLAKGVVVKIAQFCQFCSSEFSAAKTSDVRSSCRLLRSSCFRRLQIPHLHKAHLFELSYALSTSVFEVVE